MVFKTVITYLPYVSTKSISIMKNNVSCTIRIEVYPEFRLTASLKGLKRDNGVATSFEVALW